MGKVKSVEDSGKITITKSEERYPYASEILMGHGFHVLFLNMSMGLLPVTIWGSRIKYFKCSISQLYTTVFCLCYVILSIIFSPVYFLQSSPQMDGRTQTTILVAMGIGHVLAYIILLIRGLFVAAKMPKVWMKLCKLVQIAIIDAYGKKCHLFKDIRKYVIWALFEFVWVVVLSLTGSYLASDDYANGLRRSTEYYKIHLIIPLDGTPWNAMQTFQWLTYNAGYFLWHLCNSSHMLVSMLVTFIVITITSCLKSVNNQIQEFLEVINSEESPEVSAMRIKFKTKLGTGSKGHLSVTEENVVLKKIENIKKTTLIAEEVIEAVNRVWGISLIVEASILIAIGTINVFKLLATFQEDPYLNSTEKASDEEAANHFLIMMAKVVGAIFGDIVGAVTIHFYFLFKLATNVNEMIMESKKSLHLLKFASYNHLPQNLQCQVQMLKQDLASTSISVTAGNYFEINKFLITSIVSQITTYVIVLLQFYQQETTSSPSPSPSLKDS